MDSFKISNLEQEKTTLKTIRIKNTTLEKIDKISKENSISINRLINECIEYALSNISDDDKK